MVKLYVEGGGDANELRTRCRAAFSTFLTKAGVSIKPRIVACGSRQNAYESFCTAVENGEDAILLVDGEAPISQGHQQNDAEVWMPWAHLGQRDAWVKPANTADTDCHLMTQVMESWFLADREVLKHYFGQDFNENQLPAVGNALEGIAKLTVFSSLGNATRNCTTKGQYGKGAHSFDLLALIDPEKVKVRSPWARRFVDETKKKMGVV